MIATRVLTFLLLCATSFDLALTLAIRSNTTRARDPIRTVHQFESGTWIENIAVRSNGQLLLTFLQEPLLVLLDPSGSEMPVLIYRFPNATALSGIVEISPDVFAIAVGNYSLTTGAVAGSWSVWCVDLRNVTTNATGQSKINKITDVPSAIFLNGMSNLPENKDLILVGDIKAGVVFSVDVKTGVTELVISNSYTAAGPQAIFGTAGIDGLHVLDSFLYFTNVALSAFVKIPINSKGHTTGNATFVAHPIHPKYDYFDDFTFDRQGNAYLVTGSGNSIEEITVDGDKGPLRVV